jgi:hypothetical protein
MNPPANESNFKVETKKENEDSEPIFTNYLFSFMIFVTIVGTGWIITLVQGFNQKLIDLKDPDYRFPELGDFKYAVVAMFALVIIKIVVERLAFPIAEAIISKKYKNPEDEENFELGKVYIKKLATNMFKLLFYTFMTVFGYYVLSGMEFFPTSLGGSGYLLKMFEPGYPDAFFFKKPEYFDVYYLIALGFCLTDLIWLIFIYKLQSDFKLMLLHHLCTISLITFSYLTNNSNIGSIVLFLHDIADIFVYITRTVIHLEVKSWIKISTAILLQIVFIYTRLYVLADVIYSLMVGCTWGWINPTGLLTVFLGFLYIMHVNWVYLILRKIFLGIFENKFEDPASVKMQSKVN